MKRFLAWWPVILLAFVPLLPLGRAVFSSDTVGAFDQIRQIAPWNGPKPVQAWDVLQADSVLQFFVWRKLVIEDGLTSQNPYQFGGAPLAANSQSAVWYPPHLVAKTLHLDAGTAIDFLAWFHLLVAGAGVYALCRRFHAGRVASATAAISFQLSPFLLGWTALASVPSTVAWIPWVCWAALSMQASWKTWWPLPVAIAMLLTAGHLQFAAYGLFAGFACALGQTIASRDRLKIGIGITLGFGLGAALALPHLLPVMQFSQFSHRRNAPTEEGYQAYVGSAIKAHELAGRLMGPFAQGNPLVQTEALPTTYLPAITRPGANYAESAVTVGPLILIGVFLAFYSRRYKALALWFGLAGASLLVMMGSPLDRLLYFGVPGWSSTGSPGRIEGLFVMSLCVLAGIGFSHWPAKLGKVGLAVGATALVAVAGVLLGTEPYPAGLPDSHPAEITWLDVTLLNMQTVALWVIVSGVVVLLVQQRARYSAALAGLAILFPLSSGVWKLVRSGDPSFLRESIEGVGPKDLVAIVNDNWTFVGAPNALFPPNTCAVAGIRELGGYDSLMHRDTKAKLDAINGQDSSPPANGNMAFIKPSADPDKLRQAGVTQVWTLKPMPQMGQGTLHPRGFLVYHLSR